MNIHLKKKKNMDLDSILGSAKKKRGKSFSDDFGNSNGLTDSRQTDSNLSDQTSGTDSDYNFARHGEGSTITIEEPSYNYDEDRNVVEYSMKKLNNDSSWSTGDMKVVLWISEERYSDFQWASENYMLLDEYVLGHLEEGYCFPDVKITFNLDPELKNIDSRWHFVFTINELSDDGNWYIIDYRNSECYLSSDDYSSIINIICDILGLDPDMVKYDSDFIDDFGADELDMVELIMEFEKKFEIKIPDENAEEITTVGDLISFLRNTL